MAVADGRSAEQIRKTLLRHVADLKNDPKLAYEALIERELDAYRYAILREASRQ